MQRAWSVTMMMVTGRFISAGFLASLICVSLPLQAQPFGAGAAPPRGPVAVDCFARTEIWKGDQRFPVSLLFTRVGYNETVSGAVRTELASQWHKFIKPQMSQAGAPPDQTEVVYCQYADASTNTEIARWPAFAPPAKQVDWPGYSIAWAPPIPAAPSYPSPPVAPIPAAALPAAAVQAAPVMAPVPSGQPQWPQPVVPASVAIPQPVADHPAAAYRQAAPPPPVAPQPLAPVAAPPPPVQNVAPAAAYRQVAPPQPVAAPPAAVPAAQPLVGERDALVQSQDASNVYGDILRKNSAIEQQRQQDSDSYRQQMEAYRLQLESAQTAQRNYEEQQRKYQEERAAYEALLNEANKKK